MEYQNFKLIEEFKSRLDVEKVKLIESVEKKYLEIKDTYEWKELCDAHSKLSEYKRLCNVWTKEHCNEEDAYDEIKEVVEQLFVSKYENIIANSQYKDFYDKRNELKYSKDAYYLAVIEDIEKIIEELKSKCEELEQKQIQSDNEEIKKLQTQIGEYEIKFQHQTEEISSKDETISLMKKEMKFDILR